MADARKQILSWAEREAIAPERVGAALRLAGVLPDGPAWRRFADRVLLWMGAVMLASSATFFVAYNWAELGRYAKFGLAQGALVLALAAVWWRGLDRMSGQAALMAAALLTGVLFALIGQVYQTGADPFELFAAWAVAIVPWALLGRFAPLWLLCLGLANLAVALYFQAVGGWWLFPGWTGAGWLLSALNLAALAAWELAALRLAWLRSRWAPRIIATAAGLFITALAVSDIVGDRNGAAGGALAWLLWLGAMAAVYWRLRTDLYMLAGAWLSVIVVVTGFLAENVLRSAQAGSFLFIGLVVIGLAAVGGAGLRRIAAEQGR